jgi:hypothetical protein
MAAPPKSRQNPPHVLVGELAFQQRTFGNVEEELIHAMPVVPIVEG